jgi:hypothetical protein
VSERLRVRHEAYGKVPPGIRAMIGLLNDERAQAADEIERLEAEVQRLQAAIDGAYP